MKTSTMRKSAIKQALKEIQEQRKDLDELENYIKQLSGGKKNFHGRNAEEIEESMIGCQGSAYDLSMEIEERQKDITSCCNDWHV